MVVDRRRETAAVVDDDPERTVVVRRGGSSDQDTDRTVVVRRGEDTDRTRVVGRRSAPLPGEEDDEHDTDRTVARPRPEADEPAEPAEPAERPRNLPPVPSLRRRGSDRRRGLAPPPIPVGFVPPARVAVGPGAVEHYAPRELPPPPGDLAMPLTLSRPARVVDPSLPSVVRRAARTRMIAFAAFAGSCVVSVTGLALILFWVF